MYTSQILSFSENKITYTDNDIDIDWEVMMDWEDPLMAASAAYVCEGGGDVLEIGFGMGISATYIQSHTINSHTIIENHPQIIPKARAWAADKQNVTIIRKTIDGVQRFSVDMTKIDIFNSKHFYIQPNDVVFVPALRQKNWGTGATGFQTFTTIASILSVVATTVLLVKNL